MTHPGSSHTAGAMTAEQPWCDHCIHPIKPASLTRVRDWLTYHFWMVLPVRPHTRWLDRLWWAILPYAGNWAYTCHCPRSILSQQQETKL